MRLLTTLLTLFLLVGCATASAHKHPIQLPQTESVPGGIHILEHTRYQSRPAVRYHNRPVLTVNDNGTWVSVIGIPLSQKPGNDYALVNNDKINFDIAPKAYALQTLTIPNQRKVTPDPSDLKRIQHERQTILNTVQTWRQTRPHMNLIRPIPGRLSSSFGLHRIMNTIPQNRHAALDIAALTGTPIQASETGRVILSGNFFYLGNAVYIDHGQGLTTLYAHLSKIQVKQGESVMRGDIIGLVGATGRVTGPHLHFGTYLNGTAVNPKLLLTS